MTKDEVARILTDGKIFEVEDKTYDHILEFLARSSDKDKETFELLTTLIVIAAQNRRHIDRLDQRNQVFTWLIIAISIIAIAASLVPIFLQ